MPRFNPHPHEYKYAIDTWSHMYKLKTVEITKRLNWPQLPDLTTAWKNTTKIAR